LLNGRIPATPVLQAAAAARRPALDLVIDTNVVLDWLVFRNPVGAALEDALTSRQCRWLCTRPMREELAQVIRRASLARWAIDADAVLAVYDALGVDVGTPPLPGAADRLHCTDPDDQPFVDLAIARRVHALLTRDRALLRLARRARRFGVLIATPEVWLRQPRVAS
jgi:putative PIN family toxin of toxin-antitoxin system